MRKNPLLRHPWGLWIPLALAAALLAVVVLAGQLAPYDPNAQIFPVLSAPSPAHPAGTDQLGRDLLSRILVGLRTSLISTLVLVAAISLTGAAVGVVCGWRGGWLDGLLMGISDLFLAFPGLVFALAIAALLGGGLQNAVLALAAVGWPKYARLARSQTLSLKQAGFLDAARLAGDTGWQMVRRHILPGIAGPVLVTALLDLGTMLMELAGLSFLGLGARPPAAELGSMMSGGRSLLQTHPWVILGPGAAIFLAVAVLNLLGDAVRDRLDPQNPADETGDIPNGLEGDRT